MGNEATERTIECQLALELIKRQELMVHSLETKIRELEEEINQYKGEENG